jgi:hypothetical protein
MAFTGKCSRCECLKPDFEEIPASHDLLLCNLCYKEVVQKVHRDAEIGLIREELQKLSERLSALKS